MCENRFKETLQGVSDLSNSWYEHERPKAGWKGDVEGFKNDHRGGWFAPSFLLSPVSDSTGLFSSGLALRRF